MRVVVAGTYTVAAEDAKAFEEAIKQLTLAAHAERGCIQYVFSRDLEVAGRFQLFEVWESDECLEAHLISNHVVEFKTGAAAELCVKGKTQKFGVTDSVAVQDFAGLTKWVVEKNT